MSQSKSNNIQKKPPQRYVQKKTVAKTSNYATVIITFISVLVILVGIIIIYNVSKKSSGYAVSDLNSDNAANSNSGSSGDLTIQIKDISSTAKFYPVEVDGTKLEVIAVKAPDGSVRTAFNTCQVCYNSGRGYYKQEGNELVCQNCGNRFGMGDVEVTRGGCNPVPIDGNNKIANGNSITIPGNFLLESKSIFANWKN